MVSPWGLRPAQEGATTVGSFSRLPEDHGRRPPIGRRVSGRRPLPAQARGVRSSSGPGPAEPCSPRLGGGVDGCWRVSASSLRSFDTDLIKNRGK